MNCEDARKKLLLDDAGELAARGRNAVAAHLEQCSDCRCYRDDLKLLARAARRALATPEPPGEVLMRVRAAAEALAARRHVIVFRRPLVRVLAYAAALALVVGGWLLLPLETEVGDHGVRHVQTLMAMVHGGLDSEEAEEVVEDAALRALARELLIIEGFVADESSAEDETGEAPQPTALRSGSTCASRPRICV